MELKLGRTGLAIPMEVRCVLNLHPSVRTKYYFDDKKKAILVYKYPAEECLFCSGKQQIICFKRFYICTSCIQSLPLLRVFLERIERERANKVKTKTLTAKRKEALDRLHQAMKENPETSQKKLAEILGFLHAWVSKLTRNIIDS
ncbi:regulator [Paenibacillus sp. MZ04-78.2]|uniref:regulator n=1 Tax=Paenibacillus sp. MZ04-78.2 TaxID=2962034 RepID=UPI0020B68A46|nr:regulator [Paenibacillus sp. MZ04-78.2]MCP3772731.1 regulator [Paenibacillus sp. MZ04-78.2]